MGPFISQWTLVGLTEAVALKKTSESSSLLSWALFNPLIYKPLSSQHFFPLTVTSSPVRHSHSIQFLLASINLVKSLCDHWKLVRKPLFQNYTWQEM